MDVHAHAAESGSISVDLEKFANIALLTTSILAAGVVLAPLALPALGIGEDVAQTLVKECCDNLGTDSGIAGGIAALVEKVPVVGTYLNTAGGNNLLAPVGTMLGGYLAGNLVEKMEKDRGGSGKAGTMIRVGSMALGVVLALPALLPGIAHGMLYIGRMTGMENVLTPFAQALGNTTYCAVQGAGAVPVDDIKTAFASMSGAKASASVLAGHAGCLLPAAFALVAGGGKTALGKVEKIQEERANSRIGQSPGF